MTGTARDADVLVAGGGIGGFAAALAFARRGSQALLLEQAAEVREFGAGLQVTPNGAAVLRALGLGGALDRDSVVAEAVEPLDALTGRRLGSFPLEGRDYRFIHRGALLALLHEGARAAGVRVRTRTRVERAEPGGVVLDTGARLRAPLVVGADGLHSVVRESIHEQREPDFTGQVAWRALVRADQPPVARIWMAPGHHVVTYPLGDGLLNVVAVEEQGEWTAEGWNHEDDPAALRAAFADAAPELARILEAVTAVRRWGLFRHPVPGAWHRGGMVLLGDAAHPTLPFLAQGANLALEDAWVLAREGGTEGGLDRYQAQRRPRVVRAIAAAEANARHYHLSGWKRRAGHAAVAALARVAPGAFLGRLDWLYGFDVTA